MPIDPVALKIATEGLLASAALGRSWEVDLDAVAFATGAHSTAIWRSRRDRPTFVGNDAFVDGASRLNRPGEAPYTEAVLRTNPRHGGFATSSHSAAAETMRRLPFFNEVMSPNGFHSFASLALDDDEGTFLRFLVFRDQTQGTFTLDEARVLDGVAADVRFATLFARRNEELLAQRRASSFLERRESVFTLDWRGRAAPMTDAAAPCPGSPLTLKAGRLTAATDAETRRVDHVVGLAVGDRRQPGSIVMADPAGRRHQLLVMPLHGVALETFSSHRAVAALVRIGDHRRCPTIAAPAGVFLSTGFDLTGRETAVALMGAEGLAPSVIATRLGIGEGTVRNHMKGAFRKTGLHTQTELAALVARYPSGNISQ